MKYEDRCNEWINELFNLAEDNGMTERRRKEEAFVAFIHDIASLLTTNEMAMELQK